MAKVVRTRIIVRVLWRRYVPLLSAIPINIPASLALLLTSQIIASALDSLKRHRAASFC